MTTPTRSIDLAEFNKDPYPFLAEMRQETPICFVPELGATLLTKRDDIAECEKNTEVFSSHQPGGLMTVLMGENMMRKDGEQHLLERKQAFPTMSPRTVRDIWKEKFVEETQAIIKHLQAQPACDLVWDYAMPVSAHALRHVTGLTNLTTTQMNEVSQAMIDGIANYSGDPAIEKRCREATDLIDSAIDDMATVSLSNTPHSLLAVLQSSGQPMDQIRANIKLAISGGQNEPRDAIAGAVWALLKHPTEREALDTGDASWLQAFEEYARWISPIGMSPRRIARNFSYNGADFEAESRAFLMFSSGNRDESVFDAPETFQIRRDTSKAISFGAGPHFCAGAAASRVLIADVALPMLFAAFPNMELVGDVPFIGWAFRGPVQMPVHLN
ncbi:MAG: cytochrome P450 [Pseudomonadota bacterium]